MKPQSQVITAIYLIQNLKEEFMTRFQRPFQTSHPQDQLRELFETCLLLFPEDSESLLTSWKQTNYHRLYPRLIQVVIDLYNHQKDKRDRIMELFEQMKTGKLSAVHVTICYHENFRQTVENIITWNRHIAAHPHRLMFGRTAADVHAAHSSGRPSASGGT